MSSAGTAQRLRGTRVTPSLFRVLRVSPLMGRFFHEGDADEGAAPVVILSHSLWLDRFGGDPAVIGKPLTIDGLNYEIIGVAPSGFAFPTKEVGLRDDRREITLYTPFAVRANPGATVIDYCDAIARLKPGATPMQAEAEGTSYARSVDRPLADLVFGKGRPVEVRVRSLVHQMTARVRPALLVLAAGVTLVLLIACANVSNLFLSRGSARTRELAVRSALGASQARVMRQLLTESLVIALLGGMLGIFVGWALTSVVPALAPADFPRLDNVRVDARLLIVAAIAAVFVGMVSGIMPALRGSRVDLAVSMQTGGPRSVGRSGGRMLSSFGFRLPGQMGPDGQPVTATSLRSIVTPGYAEALGMRLKQGRLFRAEDRTSAIRPILVNETFAETYFTDSRPAMGRSFPGMFPNWLGKDTVVQVVGVVDDLLPAALDGRPQSQIFVAEGRGVNIGHVTLVISASGKPVDCEVRRA